MGSFASNLAAFDQIANQSLASLQPVSDTIQMAPTTHNPSGQYQLQSGSSISDAAKFLAGGLTGIIAIILGLICIAGAIYLAKDSPAGQTVQKHVANLGAIKKAAEVAA